jgi:sterol 14-demethylase
MRQMENCLKEAERLYPPLVMLMRKTLRPFEVDGVVIPAGDLVMVSPAVSHRQPKVFRNPDAFDPERFASPREEDRETPYSLIGFGGGKHRCIGMAFAHQQIKVIWGILLQRFDFDLVDTNIEPDYATFVVGPRHPCRVRYRRRQPAVFAEAG